MLVWHQWNGLAILVVIVFRLLWSVVGGSTARFSTFLRGPSAMMAYASSLLRGRPQHFLGHNPLGGWVVAVLLAIIAVEAVTGLFTTDDIIVYGPMTAVVREKTVATASALHQKIYPVLLVLIGLHVLANILYSLFGKDNLILAMITGRKPESAFIDRAPATPGSVVAAVICLIVAVVIVFGCIKVAGGKPFP
jgi:cytochrome b